MIIRRNPPAGYLDCPRRNCHTIPRTRPHPKSATKKHQYRCSQEMETQDWVTNMLGWLDNLAVNQIAHPLTNQLLGLWPPSSPNFGCCPQQLVLPTPPKLGNLLFSFFRDFCGLLRYWRRILSRQRFRTLGLGVGMVVSAIGTQTQSRRLIK